MPDKSESPGSKAVGSLAWLVGAAFEWYTGFLFIIALIGSFLFGWVAKKYSKPAFDPLLLAFAIQGGQWLCLVIGLFASPQEILFDVLILSAGLVWLITRPGWGSVVFLSTYQTLALIINASKFSQFQIGTEGHKGLSLYLVLHLAALGLMFWGLRSFLKTKNALTHGKSAAPKTKAWKPLPLDEASYQAYSDEAGKILGESYDYLAGISTKLHELYKQEDDQFQKKLSELDGATEAFDPFPFPKQIALLDELDAMLDHTRRAWKTLSPPESRRTMHDDYSRMLEYYKEWSDRYREFIRFFGTSPKLDSEGALQKHEAGIKRVSEAAAASLKKALEQHTKVKQLVVDLFVDTVATTVHLSDEEAAASYAVAHQYGFRKDTWRHYHRYAARILSIADEATTYLLKNTKGKRIKRPTPQHTWLRYGFSLT